MKISAVLITFNEERKLPDCLKSLDFADEIVILDSFSTDRTLSVAAEFNARVEQRKLDDFSSQKNHAMGMARGEWLLLIDADERVTPELRASILENIQNPGRFSAFRLTRRNHIFGGPLRHGASGTDTPIRLLRRNAGRFEGLVHERLEIQGETGELKGELTHITYQTLKDYFLKFPLFTTLDAKEWLAREKKKPSLARLLLHPVHNFIYQYFLRLGFLDGWPGLQYQVLSSYYLFVRYRKAAWFFDHPEENTR